MDIDPNQVVSIDYTNYRGERSLRRVVPRSIRFGANDWHVEPQWLMEAFDVEKAAERTFAIGDIHAWVPAVRPPGYPEEG